MAIRTTHDWIHKLATESDLIAAMQLEKDRESADLDTDAVGLANSDDHCKLVTRAIRELLKNNFSSKANARNLLRNLIQGQTYGAFAELAVYDWLTRSYVKISTQVALAATDVLGINGSTLDGKMEHTGTYFDVKAFGFNGRLAQRLKELLEEAIPDEAVLIEDSWDLSLATFQALIHDVPNIAAELKQKRRVRKGRMQIRLQPKQRVTISMHNVDSYHLAEENALCPFIHAKQFTRNSAFILIYVVHPWFSEVSLHSDFAGGGTTLTRSLARRAFMQFSLDSRPLNSVAKDVPAGATLADASRLLSAIFFINVWPKEENPTVSGPMHSWLYFNPRATHRLSQRSAGNFRAPNFYIDDFSSDDY